MTIKEFEQTINTWGQQKVPFLFFVDFELKKPIAMPLSAVDKEKILYDFNGVRNFASSPKINQSIVIEKHPLSFEQYQNKFDIVHKHLMLGDSYLTNLTIATPILLNQPLKDLFLLSKAKYKLYYADHFLVFSPETFIQIRDNAIFTYPMKGTIDASLPDAEQMILKDQKELAEHATIVDLLRNDLSLVADNVTVSRFRYIDEIKTNHTTLLQVSSEITGSIQNAFDKMGSILLQLLPAGSISGAPKKKTVSIIQEAEGEARGYYTGVMGIFDGNMLDTGVMIRFIEKHDQRLFYRSGGGITAQSVASSEYKEAIDKIYVPVD